MAFAEASARGILLEAGSAYCALLEGAPLHSTACSSGRFPAGLIQIVALFALIGFLPGCGKGPSTERLPSNAVATVNGQVIAHDTFVKELARRPAAFAGGQAGSDEKQALLEQLIRFEVLYQKALAAGYDKDPEIVAEIKRMVAAKYLEDQMAKLGHPKVGDEEVAAYYKTHADRFGGSGKVRVALIELKVPRTAQAERRAEVANLAQALLAEAATNPPADGTFGLLAQHHSEDQASRYRGGDIGWVSVDDTNTVWDPAVMAAILKLKVPEELAPVIETPTAFYLVKLVERRPARARPLPDVKAGIEWLVARERAEQQEQAFYNALKQGLQIRTNHALLEAIPLPAKNPGAPPAGPGAPSGEARKP